MTGTTLDQSSLEELLENFFIKIFRAYNRWVPYVLEVGQHDIQKVEEHLRPLCNLAYQIGMTGKRLRKETLDAALQKRLKIHTRHAFTHRGEIQGLAGRVDAAGRIYESTMMHAMADIIEEDTFLNSLTVRESYERVDNLHTFAIEQYRRRREHLESIEANVGLVDAEIQYLSVKEAVGKVVEFYESGRQEVSHEMLLAAMQQCFQGNPKVVAEAAEGYKGRIYVHNLTLKLLPTPEEMPKAYHIIRQRLHEKLGISYSIAHGIADALSQVLQPRGNGDPRELLKQSIKNAYEELSTHYTSLEEAIGKTSAISKFFIRLPKTLGFHGNYLEKIFYDLSQEAEKEVNRRRPAIEKLGPNVDVARHYNDPALRQAQILFQGYQLVLAELAEKGSGTRERQTTGLFKVVKLDERNL